MHRGTTGKSLLDKRQEGKAHCRASSAHATGSAASPLENQHVPLLAELRAGALWLGLPCAGKTRCCSAEVCGL